MVSLLVMLAQKVLAIVVAVRGAYDDVDVIPVRLYILAECNAPLVIELDDDYRALDAVVKDAIVFHASHPAKISLPEVLLHFCHFYLGMSRSHPADVDIYQTEQKVVLGIGQLVVANAGVLELKVVAKG